MSLIYILGAISYLINGIAHTRNMSLKYPNMSPGCCAASGGLGQRTLGYDTALCAPRAHSYSLRACLCEHYECPRVKESGLFIGSLLVTLALGAFTWHQPCKPAPIAALRRSLFQT
jgi:hypothetical protein